MSEWNTVWAQSEKRKYAFHESRMFRAREKVQFWVNEGIEFHPGEKVLDVGCADGMQILALLEQFKIQGYGLDFSAEALERASKYARGDGQYFDLNLGDVRKIPFDEGTFDKGLSLGVIEHLDDRLEPVRESVRVFNPVEC